MVLEGGSPLAHRYKFIIEDLTDFEDDPVDIRTRLEKCRPRNLSRQTGISSFETLSTNHNESESLVYERDFLEYMEILDHLPQIVNESHSKSQGAGSTRENDEKVSRYGWTQFYQSITHLTSPSFNNKL
jgi:hypothetical protein